MASTYKTLSAFEVATAEEAQQYFMDQVIVKVDTSADLASLPNAVKSAYVLNTGVLMSRNVANAWVPMGGVAHVGETAPADPQTGQLWVKPSERLPLPLRDQLLADFSSTITATSQGTAIGGVATASYTTSKAVMVSLSFSAFMNITGSSSSIAVRVGYTGATVGDTFTMMDGYAGTLYQSGQTANFYGQQSNTVNLVLFAGTTTFTFQGWKTGSPSVCNIAYPGISITPMAWADEYVDGVS